MRCRWSAGSCGNGRDATQGETREAPASADRDAAKGGDGPPGTGDARDDLKVGVPQAPEDEAVLREVDRPSTVLIIAFGGLQMRFAGKPPFEFFRILSRHAPTKKLFLRDHLRSWYHRGVRGLGNDIPDIEAALREIISELDVSKTVTLGTSAGGYAALLFGRLLGVSEVHAFGPQTFISPELRRIHDDRRFEDRVSDLMSSGGYQYEYGDLREVFNRTPAPHTNFVIHYGKEDELDVIHADHLGSEENIQLRGYEGVEHNVALSLRESQMLDSLVRQMTSEDRAAPP